MATVPSPSSVAARKTRMAISLRFATSSLRMDFLSNFSERAGKQRRRIENATAKDGGIVGEASRFERIGLIAGWPRWHHDAVIVTTIAFGLIRTWSAT